MRAAEGRPAARETALALVLPDRRGVAATLVAPRLLRVVGAAVVACELAHDVVAVGLSARRDVLLALGLQLGDPALRLLALLGQVDTAAGPAQRLGEEKVLIAVVAFEVGLALLIGLLDLPQLGFDRGNAVAGLARAAAFLHEALLELQADGVLGRPVDGRGALQRRLLCLRGTAGRRLHGGAFPLRGRRRLAIDRLVGNRRAFGFGIAPRPPALRRHRARGKHHGGRNGRAEGMPPGTCFTHSQSVLPWRIPKASSPFAEPVAKATMDTSS